VFGQMMFRSNARRSNGVSVKWCFGQMAFGQKIRQNDFSVK
jgi:hypothetical protein